MSAQIDITAWNTESFVFAQDVTDLAPLFNLPAGVFVAQMRSTPDSPVILYTFRNIYTEASAAGSVQFTQNPAANSTLTIGTSVVTFVASGATGMQVNIGGSLSTTLANLLTFLSASSDTQIKLCTYAVSGAQLQLQAATSGYLGNSIALATTVTGATLSGTTLTGGAHIVTLFAPISEIEGFVGSYSYDCRWNIDGLLFEVLFGGTVTFNQGVTREASDSLVTPANVAAPLALRPSILNLLVMSL